MRRIWTTLLLALPLTATPATMQADLHLDTLTQLYARGVPLDAPTGLEAGLAQLRAGGTNVAVFALWPPRNVAHRERVMALLSKFEAEDARIDGLALARSPAEARALAEAGKVAALLSLEGAHGLGEDWQATLTELHRRGLAMLGLTWSFSNRFAGSSGDDGGGLTDEGRALVARARQLGVLIDVSHASRAATLEVCKGSAIPVVASHSDALTLTANARNLSDEEIRCIAATGGVIGLNFHAPFLGTGADVHKAAAHLEHIASVGGDGVLALGSDYDGYIKVPTGLEDASKLGALWAALRERGWSEQRIQGLRGENFLRAWEGAQRAAKP